MEAMRVETWMASWEATCSKRPPQVQEGRSKLVKADSPYLARAHEPNGKIDPKVGEHS